MLIRGNTITVVNKSVKYFHANIFMHIFSCIRTLNIFMHIGSDFGLAVSGRVNVKFKAYF